MASRIFKCWVCDEEVVPPDGVIMNDGRVLHSKCYQKLVDEAYEAAKRAMIDASRRFDRSGGEA